MRCGVVVDASVPMVRLRRRRAINVTLLYYVTIKRLMSFINNRYNGDGVCACVWLSVSVVDNDYYCRRARDYNIILLSGSTDGSRQWRRAATGWRRQLHYYYYNNNSTAAPTATKWYKCVKYTHTSARRFYVRYDSNFWSERFYSPIMILYFYSGGALVCVHGVECFAVIRPRRRRRW